MEGRVGSRPLVPSSSPCPLVPLSPCPSSLRIACSPRRRAGYNPPRRPPRWSVPTARRRRAGRVAVYGPAHDLPAMCQTAPPVGQVLPPVRDDAEGVATAAVVVRVIGRRRSVRHRGHGPPAYVRRPARLHAAAAIPVDPRTPESPRHAPPVGRPRRLPGRRRFRLLDLRAAGDLLRPGLHHQHEPLELPARDASAPDAVPPTGPRRRSRTRTSRFHEHHTDPFDRHYFPDPPVVPPDPPDAARPRRAAGPAPPSGRVTLSDARPRNDADFGS